MSEPTRPLPRPSLVTQPYWDAAAAHKLTVQECASCGHVQFYPRIVCTECASAELNELVCTGRGEVYTYTINHRAPHAYFKAQTPYVVAMVELEEGVRLMANIVGPSARDVQIGAPVMVEFEDTGQGITLPQFRLID